MFDQPESNPNTTSGTAPLSHHIMVLTDASECEIVENTAFEITYRVAYITSHGGYQALSPTLLSKYKLDGVVKINHMPLLPGGERDIEALKAIIPPIDLFKHAIENKVIENTAIKEASVLIMPADRKPPTLHLQSLLNANSPSNDENGGNKEALKCPSLASNSKRINAIASKVDALVVGAPLKNQTLNKTLTESLINAAKTPHANISYLNESSTETIHLNTLLDEARCIHNNLLHSGVNAGDYVLIHAEQAQEIIPVFWACILGGIIPTITPTPPTYHNDATELSKLTGVWELLGKPVVIGSSNTQEGLKQSGIIGTVIQHEQCLIVEDLLIASTDANHPEHISNEDDIAFICLSSGSTGTPKCIQMTHKNVLVRSRGTNHICGNSSDDIILNWLPFDHIGSISDWHIRCIELGCQMVYCNKEAILAAPLEWIDIIDRYRISHTWAPNFAYSAVNAALKQNSKEQHWDLTCVKIFLTAAETVSAQTIHEFTSRLSQYHLNKNSIKPAFGMAEMGSGVTYNHPKRKVNVFTANRDSISQTLQEAPQNSPNSVSFTCLGDIIPSMAMRIVNKQGKLVKEGVIGHLHMKGDCVSPGYYKNDHANAVFLNDGWMDTGDEGFILDQKLYLSGRTKDTIIIGGANYLPIEIEKIVESVEGIAVSYVAATAVKPAQEKNESLAIFFSLSNENAGLDLIVKQIKEFVSQKMGIPPNYLICLPKHEIPKTAIGKIQRSKLTKQLEQGKFNHIIKEIDLLVENNRTMPDWFCEKSWVNCRRPSEYQPSITSLILLSYGQQSIDIAKKIKEKSIKNSIDCTIFYCGKEKTNNDEKIINIDIAKENQTLIDFNEKNLDSCNIVNLIFLEDFKKESNNQLLSTIQCTKKIIASLEDKKIYATSLVTLDAQNQLLTNSEAIFYQSLPSLFRSVFANTRVLNTCIDIKKEGLIIKDLYKELLHPLDDQEIYLKQNNRYVSRFHAYQKLSQKSVSNNIENHGLYVITGGLGGIGQEVSTWLLSHFNAKLIIIGRSTLSDIDESSSKKQALNALKSLGDVFYINSDLNNANELNHSIKIIETSIQSKVSGFFHLAGIVKETTFADDAISSMASVLQAKAYSALNIHQLVTQRPEATVVYFSSTLSSISSPIAPVYALANRMLDNLSALERKQGIKSYSIAWSAWKNTGMSENTNIDSMLAAQGLYSLTPEQALSTLMLVLSKEPSNIMIGVNRFSNALSKLNYNHIRSDDILHLAYVTSQAPQVVKHWLNTNEITQSIESTQIEKIVKNKDDSINSEKMISIINGEEEFIAARTELEKTLSDIWCQTLKIDRVSINDNFFALGGHSLLAAELTRKINKALHTKFSIGIIFEAATISAQTQLINTPPAENQAQIIALQNKGNHRPLFCLCGIDLYQTLADKLGPEIPVYGIFLPIEGRLLDINNTEQIDVESMAKEYAATIMRVQNQGPYRLAGISFGGVLAYETAKQLKAAGNDIELLSMIDFVLPNQPLRNIFQYKKLTTALIVEFFDTITANIKNQIRNLIGSIKKYKNTKDNQMFIQHEYKRAWKEYKKRMQPWDNSESVMIFRSKDEPHRQGYSKSVSCGWEHFMNKIPESYMIPGDHLGVLKEPNVDTMAKLLKTRLLK